MLIKTHNVQKFPYSECGGIILWNVHSTKHLREELNNYIDKFFQEEKESFEEVTKEEMFYSVDEIIDNSEEISLSETGVLLKYLT